MLTKDKVLDTVEKLPPNFTLDELIDKLVFVEKVNEGIRQSDDDEVVSHEDAKKKLGKWFK